MPGAASGESLGIPPASSHRRCVAKHAHVYFGWGNSRRNDSEFFSKNKHIFVTPCQSHRQALEAMQKK
ncbi:hypothetical protein BGLA2_280020 [Burkholderia gladioli]|nr:hypothetical protein BGLA2_280020 [Burkholderia gladioli]